MSDSWDELDQAGDSDSSPEVLSGLASHRQARVRAAVAANHGSPLPVLAALSQDPAVTVRKAVASNPAAAPLLDGLARDVKPRVRYAAAANPAAPLAVLLAAIQGPTDLATVTWADRETLLARPDCPSVFYAWAAENAGPALAEVLAAHPRTPLDTVESLLVRGLARSTCANPSLDQQTLRRWAGSDALALNLAAAEHPNTPIESIRRLAAHRVEEVAASAHANAALPLPEALDLLRAADPYWAYQAIGNPARPIEEALELAEALGDGFSELLARDDCDAALLDRLASHSNTDVRQQVAYCPELPASVLDSLARDASSHVRCVVARREDLTPGQMQSLAADVDVFVRSALAGRWVLPESVQLLLAQDADPGVRADLASNNHVSTEVLTILVSDVDQRVARLAGQTLELRSRADEIRQTNYAGTYAWSGNQVSLGPRDLRGLTLGGALDELAGEQPEVAATLREIWTAGLSHSVVAALLLPPDLAVTRTAEATSAALAHVGPVLQEHQQRLFSIWWDDPAVLIALARAAVDVMSLPWADQSWCPRFPLSSAVNVPYACSRDTNRWSVASSVVGDIAARFSDKYIQNVWAPPLFDPRGLATRALLPLGSGDPAVDGLIDALVDYCLVTADGRPLDLLLHDAVAVRDALACVEVPATSDCCGCRTAMARSPPSARQTGTGRLPGDCGRMCSNACATPLTPSRGGRSPVTSPVGSFGRLTSRTTPARS